MGIFRPSRERRGPDRYYHWKAILFSVGAAFGLGAIVTGWDWLIWIAVPILAVGVALRWAPGGTGRRPEEEEDENHPDQQLERPPEAGVEEDPPEIPPHA